MIKIVYLLILSSLFIFAQTKYRVDDASEITLNHREKGSHIKVFIPTMPYLYLSKLINGTLIRSSDNSRGWEYMLAKKLERKGKLIYIFSLKENIKFQDGTLFNADSVIENLNALLTKPFSHRDFHKRIKSIKKISKYKVEFTFKKPYELFLYELATMNIYSSAYLEKYSWGFDNAYAANNMKTAGAYGLGPYILTQGYAVGKKQTPIIKLKANPYYYEKEMPYIENITIYTELTTKEILNKALEKEGELDITPIPFNKKVETILSPYTKLITSPSKNNISIFFNMLKPNGILKDQKIRLALNQAICQEKLLKFVYKKEGVISPTTVNKTLYSVSLATKHMLTHREKLLLSNPNPDKYLKNILNGITLNVLTMEQYMFLWRGIEFQLKQYGVTLRYTTTKSERNIFYQLLTNRENPKEWDILTWENDSWSSNNPWTVFFHYRTDNAWAAIDKDETLLTYTYEYFEQEFNSKPFLKTVQNIINRVYKKAYMLVVPSPNIVLAVNKEIEYTPSQVLLMPLWKAKITPFHWSVRKGSYPKSRQIPIIPKAYIK